MKLTSLPLCVLAATVILPGCANLRPSADTSRAVIDSLMTTDRQHTPWHLGVAWQSGSTGGASLRSASYEHVVRKKTPVMPSSASSQVARVSPIVSPTYSDEDIDRAWRKFCRHQIDMIEPDRQIVRDTPIPDRLIGQCYSGGLFK